MASTALLLLGNVVILALFFIMFRGADLIWVAYWLIVAALYSFVVWGFLGTIELHRRAKNAWAQIDVQLQKRNDLVPNLVETVKGYTKHEKGIMDSVTKARSEMVKAKTSADKAKASGLLSGALGNIFAIAENYPQLKASDNFKLLQEQLEGIESNIAFSRQFYNDSVMRYDQAVSGTNSLFAKLLGYKKGEFAYFEAPKEAKAVPKVKF